MGGSPTSPRSSENRTPKPDLTETLIILLISAAMTMFVFWISSQYLGRENFSRLPDWISGPYKLIWTSATTGVVGVGLAIVKAFRTKSKSHPDYLKYVGITTSCMLVPIFVIIGFGQLQNIGLASLPLPIGVTRIKLDRRKTDFELGNPWPSSSVTITYP